MPRRRRTELLAVAVLAACGSSKTDAPPLPAVFDGGPGAKLRACASGVAWAEKVEDRCRIDREIAGVGCVRAIADRAQVGLYVWKGCSAVAAPIAATIARKDPATVVTLPEGLRDPVWAVAIGGVLVGPKAVVGESAATGALAWVLDATHPEASPDLDGVYRFVPRWTSGVPQPPALAAAVLDPKVARADATRAWSSEVTVAKGASLVVVDAGAPLEPIAKCAAYEIVGNATALAAVRTDDRTWSYVAIDGSRNPRVPVTCSDRQLVHVPRGDRGIASELIVAPRRGVFVDVEPVMRDQFSEGELAKLIVPPPASLPVCDDATPLVAAKAPCVAHGGDWTLRARGEGAPPLGWIYERTGRDPVTLMTSARPFAALPGDEADVAERLVGASHVVKCAGERCANGDAVFGWLFAGGFVGRFDDRGVVAPKWVDGDTPVLPAPEIAVAPMDPRPDGLDGPVLVYAALGGPVELRALCGGTQVYTSPHAGGVVDVARHRWAWLFFDRAADTALVDAHCIGETGEMVAFDAAKASIAVEVKTGRWATMGRDEARDPAAARAALHW